MDRVHNIEDKPWISARKLCLKLCIDGKNSYVKSNNVNLNCGPDDDHDRFKSMSEKLKRFVELGANEIKPYFAFNFTDEKFLKIEPKCELKTYQLQLDHVKRMISDREYKIKYLTSLKTTRKEMLMRYLASLNQSQKSCVRALDELACDDKKITAIIVVQIWQAPIKHEKVKLEREILFRADQCLVELRDQFKCHRDYGVPMDLSDDPDQQIERIFHGELFKSGFFLIEDTFYNDLRDPNNLDLSETITNWADELVPVVGDDNRVKRVSRGIGPFRRECMEEKKFEDIPFIRLGCPYLYCHQGNCEHLFTISDIRYVTNPPADRYPIISACGIGRKEYSLKCYMCRLRPPHWYTRNNDRLPMDPYFFCENCFRSFNYDKDKKKIGDFQAYLYTIQ